LPRRPSISAAALERFEGDFAKSFGNTLQRDNKRHTYEVIPTGILELDAATVVGGYVEGRITQIWANPDAGKTSTALMGIAQAQIKHPTKVCAFIDIENKFDEEWAETLGVDRSRLYVYRPATAEDTADALKSFLTSGLCSMVVIDSVGAMMGRVEQEKQADEATVAVTARIVTRMVKHATLFAPVHGVAVIILNQVRDQISGQGGQVLPGGWALRHASTLQLKLRASTAPTDIKKIRIDGAEVPVAHKIIARVERNKVAAPGVVASWTFVNRASDKFGPVGVDTADEATSMGERVGAIKRSGAYYTLVSTGERVQGREAMVEVLRGAPDEVAAIRTKALAALKGKLTDGDSGTDDDAAEVPAPEEDVLDLSAPDVLSEPQKGAEGPKDDGELYDREPPHWEPVRTWS
jgi:protein RecA